MYKYQIWSDAGLIYDSEEMSEMSYETYDEAEEEAKLDIKFRVNEHLADPDCIETREELEDDYWYEVIDETRKWGYMS